MTQIPDAAVQAALKEWHDAWNENSNMDDKLSAYAMKEALTAAIPYLQPVDVAAVRRQTLEEVVHSIVLLKRTFSSDEYAENQPIGSFSEIFACDEILRAIRSLSAEPAHGEQWQPTKQSIRNVLKSYVDAGMQLADNLDDISNEILRLLAAPTTEAGRAALAQGGGE